jgi:hypothetical protein
MRGRIVAGIALVSALAATAAATAGDNDSGFKTSAAAMLKGVNGSSTTPIISVGDVVGDYTFESIPDGISIAEVNGRGTADIVVNHELSLVPFPATRQDATNSILSRLRLNQHSAGVLRGSYAITTDAGYQRFCSNFAVGEAQGFDRDLVLTSEEARDIVLRQADAWHQPGVALSEPGAEQAGVMVAYDVKSGAHKSIYGMGRANHENGVGVPGYGHPVVLTGDDTFDAPSSQLYLYSASSGSAFWNDEGQLYAFVSNDPAVNDYGDLTTASPSVTGHFIEVPTEIATGKKDGHEVTTADFPAEGFPSPPAGVPNGPQWVLEAWSNKNNVFQFIRIEDIAYDRTDSKTVYFADTGEPRAIPGPAPANRLARGPSGTQGAYMNGRLFRLQLNGSNPLGMAMLSILPGANFDANGYNNAASPHQPDNVETTKDAILFTEDPGGHNAQPTFAGATNARVWRYDLATHDLDVVAEVDQSVPGSPVTNKGSWESSGILDASTLFGPGSFLIDVQAHGWDMDAGTGNDAPAVPKRERGQLLRLNVPEP